MSASRERKKRMEQGQQPVPAQQKKKKKLSEGWILAISVILVVALVFGGIFTYRVVVRNQTVLTVGEHEIPVKEFNVYYNSEASSLRNYASLFGIKTGVALDELSEGWILAISVILVVALVFGGIFTYRVVVRNQTVLTVGEHEIPVKEFNVYYNSEASSLRNYASLFGIKTGVALDEQKIPATAASNLEVFGVDSTYLADKTAGEDTYDVTWAQFIAYSAMQRAVQTYAAYDAAVAAGYQLDAEALEEIESEMDSIQASAEMYGVSTDEYIENIFGAGYGEKDYRQHLTVAVTAEHYTASLRYTDEEISARYEESPENYDIATYYRYTVKASDFAEKNEDGTTAEVTDENRTAAKAAAKQMEAEFNVEDEKVTIVADRTFEGTKTMIGEDGANWIFGDAEKDAVKLFENGDTYYVVKLIDRENYQTVNAIELFIAADGEEHEHAEGEEVDHLHAEEKLAAVTEALKKDASEENFRALALEYNGEDNDGVLENMDRGTMSSVSGDLLKWASLSERKAGDYEVFETSSGTIILYFTGYGETYRDLAVSATLRSEWLTELLETGRAACGYDEDAAMRGNVGLVFSES